jgi:hypothetical protein
MGLLWLAGCGPVLNIEPPTLPNGAVGQIYAQQLSSDGEGSLSWDLLDGSLPAGLLLGARSGVLGGIPLEAGTFQFTIGASGTGLARGEVTYTLVIAAPLLVSAPLETGRVGEPYLDSVSATGGTPPYTFQVIGLPAGIGYDPITGVISGMPIYTVAGELLGISVTDSGSPPQTAGTVALLVIKSLPVSLVTTSLADARIGMSDYGQTLEAANGRPPRTWAVVSGLLPKGLELVLDTGVIRNRRDPSSGQPIAIPADSTTSTFTIQVTDSDLPATSAAREFTIAVR